MVCFAVTGWAQSSNHHPTRILITFSEESPVFEELREKYTGGAIQNEQKFKTSNTQNLPRTIHFLEDFELSEIQLLSPGKPESVARQKASDFGSHFRDRLFIGEVENPVNLMNTIELLRQESGIEIAEPDYKMKGAGKESSAFQSMVPIMEIIPNDPLFELNQWGLKNTGQVIGGGVGNPGEDIRATHAWEITTGSEEVVMAVLDSGIPLTANDFFGRLLNGYDFANDDDDPSDDHGHGTSVASIALAGGNDGSTIAGVDWNAKLLPVKILNNENSGFYSWWIDGIFFAMDNNVNVMNVSVGGNSVSSSLENAFQEALKSGIHIVACMMNENNDVTFYPAAYEGVIAVGAINNKGNRAAPFSWGGGSNYGNHIDLSAPGNNIASIKYDTPNQGGAFWSGTSQATPMVAATISLMLSLNPELTPPQSRQILIETARGDGNWDKFLGWGKLDSEAALIEAQNTLTSSENELETDKPFKTTLQQNYPNPFNPATNIQFELAEASAVTLTVYDILGREVASLLNKTTVNSGIHNISFDASDLSSGFYIYRLQSGSFSQTRKMALIK